MPELTTDIRYIKGIGEKRAETLGRLGIRTLGDLLCYFPRDYEDRTAVRPIAELLPDETACVRAMVAAGGDAMIEFGPGNVLTGLLRRTLPDVPYFNVNSVESLDSLAL